MKDEISRIAEGLGLKVGRFLGSGIHMTEQPFTQDPNPGDHAWDADWGYVMWTGEGWFPFVQLKTIEA